jgi:flagellar basal-body rod protein FlgC
VYGALDISTSGMIAQRTRMAVISANIANANTILTPRATSTPTRSGSCTSRPGDPAADPVGRDDGRARLEIGTDEDAVRMRYEPGNPSRTRTGTCPIRTSARMEQINAMTASRAYEANVVAAETTKTMLAQALRLLA